MNSAFISSFNWYGLLMATGIVAGVVGAYFAARRHGLEGDVIIDMILICLPLAILGARIYHVVFETLDPNGHNWTFSEFWGFSDGKFTGLAGLAIYGGLFGAIAGAGIFHLVKNRKSLPVEKHVSFWQIMDVGFAFIMLGQVIARWGNFTNGECYGEVITNPAFQWAPIGMLVDGEWRTSIWFYESLWNFFGFFVLLYLYLGKRKSFDGFIFAMYGLIYGVGRTWIESIRVNDVLMLGGMRVSVLVSVLFIIAGVAIILTHIIRAKKLGKKIFIFVDQKKLNADYLDYEKTKLAHPMPDIYGRKKKKQDVIIDNNGVAVKVDTDSEEGRRDTDTPSDENAVTPEQPKKNTDVDAEEVYEDKWD